MDVFKPIIYKMDTVCTDSFINNIGYYSIKVLDYVVKRRFQIIYTS